MTAIRKLFFRTLDALVTVAVWTALIFAVLFLVGLAAKLLCAPLIIGWRVLHL